jgi:hypothetical protein
MFRSDQLRGENNLGSTPLAENLNAKFTARSSRRIETLLSRTQQTEEEM